LFAVIIALLFDGEKYGDYEERKEEGIRSARSSGGPPVCAMTASQGGGRG